MKLRDHLNQVWKTLGHKPKELEEQPDFPEELRYIWNYYLELKTREPLSFSEIESWSRLTRQNVSAWEVDLIKTLDRLYWRTIRD